MKHRKLKKFTFSCIWKKIIYISLIKLWQLKQDFSLKNFDLFQQLNTSLHEKNHFLSLKQAEFEEQINAERTKNEELQNKLDDLEYEVTKARMRNGKLESTLAETQARFKFSFNNL